MVAGSEGEFERESGGTMREEKQGGGNGEFHRTTLIEGERSNI